MALTRFEEQMITRLVKAEERQAEAMERTADHLSTIAEGVKDIKVLLCNDQNFTDYGKEKKD